jgi:hypothetical protein
MGSPALALLGLLLAAPGAPAPGIFTAPPPAAGASPGPATAPTPAPPAAPPLIAAPPSPPALTGYDLRRAKDGSGDLVYEGPRFSARVAPDGAVKFGKGRPEHPFWWPPFLPERVDNGRPSLQSTLSAALRRNKQPPVESDKIVDESFLIIPNVSRYRPDPREGSRATFTPRLAMVGAGLEIDLTDTLMLLSGQDPYRIEKARFLVATRDLRVRRAAQAYALSLREATTALPARLQAIASDTSLTVADRRAILEALADEMDDSPAGRDAAARIRAFIANDFEARFPSKGPPPSQPSR